MQTFLPYASFKRSAEALDYRRLGKQRVEAYQILRTLYGCEKAGWANHPAVKMWRGYEGALTAYYNCCIQEWICRGYKNNMRRCFIAADDVKLPPWFGGKIHASHREALTYKAAQRWLLKGKQDEITWYEQFDLRFDGKYHSDCALGKSFPGYYWPV